MIDTALAWVGAALMTAFALTFAATYGEDDAIVALAKARGE